MSRKEKENKKELLMLKQLRDIFEQYNITEVRCHYSGSGDSGSFDGETVQFMDGTESRLEGAQNADDSLPLFEVTLENQPYLQHNYNNEKHDWEDIPGTRTVVFSEFVVEVAEHFVGINHSGWENNDGGFGDVVIAREGSGIGALAEAFRGRITIDNDHTDYVTTEENYIHGFVFDTETGSVTEAENDPPSDE
jgi:hypothetical protein